MEVFSITNSTQMDTFVPKDFSRLLGMIHRNGQGNNLFKFFKELLFSKKVTPIHNPTSGKLYSFLFSFLLLFLFIFCLLKSK